jgi:hypothetical protein
MTSEHYHSQTPQTQQKRKYRKRTILLIVLGVLLVVRIILPYVVLHYANQRLASLDGHYGHIRDIDLAIIRGAYTINDIYINKTDEQGKTIAEFFKAETIDLSVEWRALFEGKLVAEVEFERPVLNYKKDANIGENAPKDSTNFIQLIKDFTPLDINRFQVNNGEIHYLDESSNPLVDIPLTRVQLEGKGLTNNPSEGVALPASIMMNAALYDGEIDIDVALDPLNDAPTFDLDAVLTKTELTYLNPFFTEYARFDLKAGNMEMACELAAKDGQFAGYVKPVIKDLDIIQFEEEEGNLAQIAWEALVGAVAEVFQNQPKEQIASKIDLNGRFTDPHVAFIPAVISVLKNAFIKALQPSVEHTIDLNKVAEANDKPGLLHRLFHKDEDAALNEPEEKSKREQRREERQKKKDKK